MYKKATVVAVLLAITVVFLGSCTGEKKAAVQPAAASADVYPGWHLGVQAYTFRDFTFYEAVDKTKALGLKWIEAYPGQVVSKDKPEITFKAMPVEMRAEVKKKLAEAGITVINYGTVRGKNDEAQWRKEFEFAKDMGIKTLVAEPTKDAFEMLDKLCQEYKISIAVHNHPKGDGTKPPPYWSPEDVLAVCKDRSKYIGSCADIGHWKRSGLDPIECLKKLDGRIVSVHLKDINEKKDDVPWGTGICNFKGVLEELDRQNFQGVMSIEYEHSTIPAIEKSIEYYNKVAGEIAKKHVKK